MRDTHTTRPHLRYPLHSPHLLHLPLRTGILAPQLVNLPSNVTLPVLGFGSLIVGLLALTLPETRGVLLRQISSTSTSGSDALSAPLRDGEGDD